MSFFYERTVTLARGASPGSSTYNTVASGIGALIQMRRGHKHTGIDSSDTDQELFNILPDPAYGGAWQVGDQLTDDLGRTFLVRGAYQTPLGWQLEATDWTVAGTLFPSRPLYIVEQASATTQDPNTGLPVVTPSTATLITPAPMVRYGGHLMVGQGGGVVQMGEVEVSNLDRTTWPPSRLLAAIGFHIDTTNGELYQIALGRIEDAGVSTLRFWLERASQPRV